MNWLLRMLSMFHDPMLGCEWLFRAPETAQWVEEGELYE